MKFKEAVEKAKIAAREENINILRKDIKKSDVVNKIKNYIIRWPQFSYEEVENKILTDDLVASCFAKDPSKQNISEKMAEQWLEIEKLPPSGAKCIRFSRATNKIVYLNTNATKSADFLVNNYYATQKYTMQDGGAQDNQKNDVIDFLRVGSVYYKVMAIVDGDYWDNGNRELLKKEFINNPNVIITSIDEILERRI